MNTDDIHSLAGAYAVDAVDDVERARFEAHVTGCSQCQDEVTSLRAAAVELSATTVTAPPPSLRAAVLRDISSVRPLPPEVSPSNHQNLSRSRSRLPRRRLLPLGRLLPLPRRAWNPNGRNVPVGPPGSGWRALPQPLSWPPAASRGTPGPPRRNPRS